MAEEYWHANPEMQKVPIYFSSKLASKSLEVYKASVREVYLDNTCPLTATCTCRNAVLLISCLDAVYQTYISQMNARVQAQLRERNPFEFRYIRNLESVRTRLFLHLFCKMGCRLFGIILFSSVVAQLAYDPGEKR
jgi:cleavage and polyadenylation specificity factor subunit 3